MVDVVCDRLRDGADLGARGSGTIKFVGPNHKGFYEHGERAMDTIMKWVRSSPPLICGPLTEEQMFGGDVRINPLQGALKPNGDCRVCVDQSFPRAASTTDPYLDPAPISVNASIDTRWTNMPTFMITTTQVLERLIDCLPSFLLTKVDWADAYKHCPVCLKDIRLNCVKIGSRYFAESACTFGCSSSPSIYEMLSEICIRAVNNISGVPRSWTLRMIDDNVLIAPEAISHSWTNTFVSFAKETGIKLAPFEGDKAFPPSTSGAVLGVVYDLPTWSCRLEERKLLPIIDLLFQVEGGGPIPARQAQKPVGKLVAYRDLIGNDGRKELSFIYSLLHQLPNDLDDPVHPSGPARSQAAFWIDRLTMLNLGSFSRIPDPRPLFPAHCIRVYTDAAGLDSTFPAGWGSVSLIDGRAFFAFNRWPRGSLPLDGKMTCLESLAALGGLISILDKVASQAVEIMVDNQSAVRAFAKGASPDLYTASAILAIHRVARARDLQVRLTWVPRCSDAMTNAADLLSRGNLSVALEALPGVQATPGLYSQALAAYCHDPIHTRTLGQSIIKELSANLDTIPGTLEREADVNIFTHCVPH